MPEFTWWQALVIALISGGGASGLILLFRTPGEMRKTDATTGLTNTEAAERLTTSSLALVVALERRAVASEASAKEAEDRARTAEAQATQCNAQLRQTQSSADVLQQDIADMQQTLTGMKAELEAYRSHFGPLPTS